jgi:nucleoside-diphosphate-sugar epimerase
MSASGTALVLGASGVTGTPFCEQLLAAGWPVYGVSRRSPKLSIDAPLARFTHVPLDLEDAEATRAAVRAHSTITHVYHCANAHDATARLRMLTNLLDALEAFAPEFRNINLMQGMKYYGCHLGPFRTPAREDDPRRSGDFYYQEEDLVRRRQAGRTWTWTALRPHSVCGYSSGSPLNLAVALGVYASLRRAGNEPLWFPASPGCFRALFQVIDADVLARGAIHVSTTPACANGAFNIGNGDIFRWQNFWPVIAAWFGIEPAGPSEEPLAEYFERNALAWQALVAKHGLRAFPYERLPNWVRGDYAAPNSRFAAEYDIIADTVKLCRTGFCGAIDSDVMFVRLFGRYRAERIIP